MLSNRISLFVSLPLRSLDKLTLQRQLRFDRRQPKDSRSVIGRRLAAEGVGHRISASPPSSAPASWRERLAGGNVAIALLCNTIPTGAILVVLITIFAPVSGAHFNPGVTLAFAATGERPWRERCPISWRNAPAASPARSSPI